MRMGLGVAAVISVVLAMGAASALAATNDGRLGGPAAGTADDTLCPEGQAVTGVEGATRTVGGFIPVVAVATVQCTDGTGTTMGSGTGNPDSTSCPEGTVAIGIEGREGDFVDFLQLRCQAADGSGPITTSDGIGGGFGTADGPYDCPEGQVLTGLTGQSVFDGSTIRYVEIVCSAVVLDEDGDGIADTPPPAEKAACKDGGWTTFNNPSFNNQGQCVAYVEKRR